MSGRLVRRPHQNMVLTPETTSTSHSRISVRCNKCQAPQPIVAAFCRYQSQKMWSLGW